MLGIFYVETEPGFLKKPTTCSLSASEIFFPDFETDIIKFKGFQTMFKGRNILKNHLYTGNVHLIPKIYF